MKDYLPLYENKVTYSSGLENKSKDEAKEHFISLLDNFNTIPKSDCVTYDEFIDKLQSALLNSDILLEYVSSKDINKGDDKSVFVIYNSHYLNDQTKPHTITVGLKISDSGDNFTLGKYFY